MMTRRTNLGLVAALALVACSTSDSDKDQGVNNPLGDGDVTDSDATPDAKAEDAAAVDEPFGRICKLGDKCPDDPQGYPNVCVAPEDSDPGKGFCTRTCNAEGGGTECFDVPNGQWAACILKGPGGDAGPGLSYCVFLCKLPERRWTCPATLSCGEEKDEVALCVPKAK